MMADFFERFIVPALGVGLFLFWTVSMIGAFFKNLNGDQWWSGMAAILALWCLWWLCKEFWLPLMRKRDQPKR